MKRMILVVAIAMLVSGCSSSLLNKIPNAEFEAFSYHRGGNVSSATVTATGAKKEADSLVIEDVHITEDWGPAFSVDIQLRGYRMELKAEDGEQ